MNVKHFDCYHQKDEAWYILGHGFSRWERGKRTRELKLVSLLLRDELGMKGEGLKRCLETFCKKHIEDYHPRRYYQLVNTAYRFAEKRSNVLIQVDGLEVYQSELEYIQGLGLPEADQKVMFTILMTKKMDGFCYRQRFDDEYNMGFLRSSDHKMREIRKSANVGKVDIAGEVFYRWREMGLIRVTYTGFILDFMEQMKHDGEIAMEVKHYDCYGKYYESLMEGDRRTMCHSCGKPIVKGKTRKKLCKECALEFCHISEPTAKKYTCIICGETFFAEARASRTCKCPKCVKGED